MIRYLAFVLSAHSQDMLRTKFNPIHSNVLCHHITIIPDLSAVPDEGAACIAMLSRNKPRVLGTRQGLYVDAVAISFGYIRRRYDGSYYHVTLSVADYHSAVEANDLSDEMEMGVRGMFYLDGAFSILQREDDQGEAEPRPAEDWRVDRGVLSQGERASIYDVACDDDVGPVITVRHPDPVKQKKLAQRVANALNTYEGD